MMQDIPFLAWSTRTRSGSLTVFMPTGPNGTIGKETTSTGEPGGRELNHRWLEAKFRD